MTSGSIFGPIHLQHRYPNYPNLDIYILDVISNVNIRIDPFATLVPKLPKSIIYIYIHILDITSGTYIYMHILDITSRIHIHIWRPPGRHNGGLGGRMPPQESKSDRCEELFTLLDFRPQIPNLVIPISTISMYQNRSI